MRSRAMQSTYRRTKRNTQISQSQRWLSCGLEQQREMQRQPQNLISLQGRCTLAQPASRAGLAGGGKVGAWIAWNFKDSPTEFFKIDREANGVMYYGRGVITKEDTSGSSPRDTVQFTSKEAVDLVREKQKDLSRGLSQSQNLNCNKEVVLTKTAAVFHRSPDAAIRGFLARHATFEDGFQTIAEFSFGGGKRMSKHENKNEQTQRPPYQFNTPGLDVCGVEFTLIDSDGDNVFRMAIEDEGAGAFIVLKADDNEIRLTHEELTAIAKNGETLSANRWTRT